MWWRMRTTHQLQLAGTTRGATEFKGAFMAISNFGRLLPRLNKVCLAQKLLVGAVQASLRMLLSWLPRPPPPPPCSINGSTLEQPTPLWLAGSFLLALHWQRRPFPGVEPKPDRTPSVSTSQPNWSPYTYSKASHCFFTWQELHGLMMKSDPQPLFLFFKQNGGRTPVSHLYWEGAACSVWSKNFIFFFFFFFSFFFP